MRRRRGLALAGILLAAAGAGAVWARLLAGGPVGPLPGGWLRGDRAAVSPRDWSFASHAPYLLVESDAWTLPYSANVWFIVHEGRLHLLLPSFFGKGLKHRLDDDPRLTVAVGGTLYSQVAVPVTDPQAIGALLAPVVRRQFAIEILGDAQPVGHAAELWVYRLEDPPGAAATPARTRSGDARAPAG